MRAAVACVLVLAACQGEPPPQTTYYERVIGPILESSCSGNTGGCHVANPEDPFSFAAGNFDVSSFENVKKRQDVLEVFGPYPVPLLLVKATGGTDELDVLYNDEVLPLEVRHAGGGIIGVGSDAYLTLLEWMENGATENGLPPPPGPEAGTGPCSTFVPDDFDEAAVLANSTFDQFESEVAPVLEACSSGSCHGAPQADFYITCGDGDRQVAFNFSQARAFVDDPVDNSQILQIPLATGDGGYFHTGGEHFESREGADYLAVAAWAEAVGPTDLGDNPGFQFFVDNVQPIFIQRGCAFEACHSPAATNDFKLRAGSRGFFSPIALRRNYELLKHDFMALEVPDARRGRAVAKSILGSFGGIAHRGGPVLETAGAGGSLPENCADPFDPATASAFCAFQEWIDIERAQLIADGSVLPLGETDTVPIVYVQRAAEHVASPLEFDTYQPGSDLLVADAVIGAAGGITSVGAPRSLLTGCPDVGDLSAVDVSGPDVRFDGTTIAFAMRTAADDPLGIYTVNLDGTACTRVTPPEAAVDGVAIHNFDPAWSPDGEWIVYASTRGAASGDPAPTLSRKRFLPQSDIFRMRPDGSERTQLTFLTNSEIEPQMIREGRMVMTTEKVSEGFYQLSGRRMNWDITDYHPLLGQRAESPFGALDDPTVVRPSVGYARVTDIREAFNGNYLIILADPGARGGAGTLATFNRSVGPMELSRDDPGFLPSMQIIDPAATGRVGEPTNGAYRSPFALPAGRILVSYAAFSGDLGTATALDYDLVAIDPHTGERETLLDGTGQQVEAVLALKYPPREPYENFRQLVFGGFSRTEMTGGDQWAVLHIPDAPLIFTLLNANLRRGRPAKLFADATQLAIYEELAPPAGADPNLGDIYQQRTLLGKAPLLSDGSVKVRVPAGTGVILELQNASGEPVVTMKEEHQLGPGEVITFGVNEKMFDGVCGGCHGSISGNELDATIVPDVLTGASQSLAAPESPATF